MSKPIKNIIVGFSDRTYWSFPAHIVADARAKYFAEVDSARGDGEYDEVYKQEYDYTISDESELKDWMMNNMNWEDVKDFATQIKSEDFDYEKEWNSVSIDFE